MREREREGKKTTAGQPVNHQRIRSKNLFVISTRTTAKPHNDYPPSRIKPHPSPRSFGAFQSKSPLSKITFFLLCVHWSEKFLTPPTTLIEGAQQLDQFYCLTDQNGLFSSKVVKGDLQRQFLPPPDKRSSSLICLAKMAACK